MNTHDIDRLIDKIEASAAMDIAGRSKHIHDLRAAIEADRQGRGEPVLVGWTVGVDGGGILHASKHTEDEAKRAGYPLAVYRLVQTSDKARYGDSHSGQPAASAIPVPTTKAEYIALLDMAIELGKKLNIAWEDAFRATKGQPAASAEPNAHTDDDAVDHFAAAMKDKLAQARAKGRHGWHECDPADLSAMLRAHVEKGDPLDVANFCMFLWSLGQPISAAHVAAQAQPVVNQSLTTDLLERVSDALGRFVSDEGWGQADMDLCDEFSAALAALSSAQDRGAARR